jgi:hypothetical protein
LVNGTNYDVPHCGAFSTPHLNLSRAQIFASGSCFQITLACVSHLIMKYELQFDKLTFAFTAGVAI